VRDLESSLVREGLEAGADTLRRAQGMVWGEVDAYSEELRVSSSTSALDEISEGAGSKVDEWVESLPPREGQVGLLVFLDGRPLGLDVIGGRTLYARLHERLLRGYALDVLGARARRRPAREERPEGGGEHDVAAGETGGEVDESDALRFLDRVQRATRTPSPTVGRGEYFVLSDTCVGAELVDGSHLAHRNAFGD